MKRVMLKKSQKVGAGGKGTKTTWKFECIADDAAAEAIATKAIDLGRKHGWQGVAIEDAPFYATIEDYNESFAERRKAEAEAAETEALAAAALALGKLPQAQRDALASRIGIDIPEIRRKARGPNKSKVDGTNGDGKAEGDTEPVAEDDSIPFAPAPAFAPTGAKPSMNAPVMPVMPIRG